VTSYKELYRDGNDCARWNMLHPTQKAKVPYVTETLQSASGPFIAASDYMKVLPESIAQWVPGKLVALGTDGFGRSENRESLRDFFEVDAKHIVLATLHALANEKSGDKDKDKKDGDGVSSKMLEKAIRDLGIDPEKRNPANT
jgi:pyruvate dehydrogenase E1 component